MAVHKIKFHGEAVLARDAKAIKGISPEIKSLIRDMIETMYECNGVGLAAPQIGIAKRLSVIDCGKDYMQEPLVLINPEIIAVEGEQFGSEGCLSIPNLFMDVARPLRVTARYRNADWKSCEITGERLLARALAHEVDHLNGTLFIKHVTDRALLASEMAKLQKDLETIIVRRTAPLREPR